MTDDSPAPDPAPVPTPAPAAAPRPAAERIAKVIARAGLASRREAERMIVEGRVTVNGARIDSPALDVAKGDRIAVDGKMLEEPQETRLWLYYKPVGLVTSEADEKGRQTVFDALPRDLPRVMTVGRLDLTSEGLLLLTNDGALKRRLELPSTGWLRRYRVRVNGTPSDMTFAPLRRGATIEGEEFAPMEITLDSQQGANAWLTVGIREGKNREIRRAMAHVGLQVNRLIRIGYGPFKLTGMERNEVVEVKRRVLRDQLGGLLTGEEAAPGDRPRRPHGAAAQAGADRPRRAAGQSPRRGEGGDDGAARPPRSSAPRAAASGASAPRGEGGRPARPWSGKPRADETAERPQFRAKRPPAEGERPARSWSARPRTDHDAAGGDRPRGGKPVRAPRAGSPGDRPRDDASGTGGGFKARGARPAEARAGAPRHQGGPKPRSDASESGDRARNGFKPRRDTEDAGRGFRSRTEGKPGDKGSKPGAERPEGGFRTRGDAPRPGGQPGGKQPGRDRKPLGKPGGPRAARGIEQGAMPGKPRSRPGAGSGGGGKPRFSGKPGKGGPAGGKPRG